eukprot:4359853-Pleurochrysis_carterae.AAC.1
MSSLIALCSAAAESVVAKRYPNERSRRQQNITVTSMKVIVKYNVRACLPQPDPHYLSYSLRSLVGPAA